MDPKPACLHLLDCTMFWSPSSGGVQRYLRAKHDWLAHQANVRHRIVAPLPGAGEAGDAGDGRSPGWVDCGGWPIPRSGGYRFPWRRRSLARLLCEAEPDVIEAADPYGLAWAALEAGQRRGIPVVAFCHSNLPRLAAGWLGSQGWAARAAERAAAAYLRRVYQPFDRVLAPSRVMTQTLIDLGVPQARHQPLGVDTRRFHPAVTDARAALLWRHRTGLAKDACVLVYTGRLAPEKHLDVLVAAVERLGPPYVLLLVGDGPCAPAQSPRVRHWPHVRNPDALARIIASADLFVHAGDQETFGLSVLEAMACGTPVMVRAAAGLAELVAGGAGTGVPDNRVDTWAQAISAWFAERDHGPSAAQARAAERAQALARAHDWQVLLPPWLAQMRHLAHWSDAVRDRPWTATSTLLRID